MMLNTKTTHKCDHCGKETVIESTSRQTNRPQSRDAEFWGVRLSIEEAGIPSCVRAERRIYDRTPEGPAAYWCRACCEKFGLLPSQEKQGELEAEASQVMTPPTFEDLLRELVQEEVYNAQP